MRAMDLEATLAERFRPAAAADVDIVVGLAVDGGERLTTFTVRQGALRFEQGTDPAPADAVFYFDSAKTALGILGGGMDVMAAFMAGAFRADGHLPLAFVLLGLFHSGYDATPPE